LGVAALDTATGRRLGYRDTELFAMCSTFKFLLAGCILKRVDAGSLGLNNLISYGEKTYWNTLRLRGPVWGRAQ
jgi:beta-lactamase class A